MLTKKDRIKVLAGYIANLEQTIFIEEMKLKLVQKHAISGQKEYGKVFEVKKGQVAALKGERDFMLDQLELIKSE